MFYSAKFMKKVLVVWLLCLMPGVARADSSCDGLFSRLRASASSLAGGLSDARAQWATNYFAPERGERFVGTTQIVFGLQQGDLFGTATRLQTVYSTTRPTFQRSDEVSLRIRREGQIMLNDRYGPFDPTCTHDKYAIIRSGDSVEVFTLYVTNPLQVTIVGAGPDQPTILTLFEHANFAGRSHSLPIQPQPLEHVIPLPSNALRQVNLWGQVSSARLACGTRASRASLFDVDWSKDSKGAMIECHPGQTASANFATFELNDKINAAVVVAHTRAKNENPVAFSNFMTSAWRTHLAKETDITPTGTAIWLANSKSFIVEQWMTLDHPLCFERQANFSLRVSVSANAMKPLFQVEILSRNVMGDRWGCYSSMLEKLNSSLGSIRTKLQSELHSSLGALTGRTFYFAPAEEAKSFHLFYGG